MLGANAVAGRPNSQTMTIVTYEPLKNWEKAVVVALAVLTLPLFGVLGFAAYYHFKNKHKITTEITNPTAALAAKKANEVADVIKQESKTPAELKEQEQHLQKKTQELLGFLKDISHEIKQNSNADPEIAGIMEKHGIFEIIESISDEPLKEGLQTLVLSRINTYLINRELSKKTKVLGTVSTEIEILKALGKDIPKDHPYEDKDMLYGLVQSLIRFQLNKDFEATDDLKKLKGWFQHQALKARLATVDIKDEIQIEKFGILLLQKKFIDRGNAHNNLTPNNQLKVENANKLALIDAQFPRDKFPIQANLFAEIVDELKFECLDVVFQSYVTNRYKKYLFDNDSEVQPFDEQNPPKQLLNYVYSRYIELLAMAIDLHKQSYANHIKFYEKYANNLKKEFIQGFDDSSKILGGGACWGIESGLQRKAEEAPTESDPKNLGLDDVKAEDRYNQAIHKLGVSVERTYLPPVGYRKEEELSLIRDLAQLITNPESLAETLSRKIGEGAIPEDKMSSVKYIPISFYFPSGTGHAVSIRIDDKNNQFWLFDPNVGFFTFENEENKKAATVKALADLISTFYPSATRIVARYREKKVV